MEETLKNMDSQGILAGWEVYNFMSLTHAKFTFDDRNIIGLMGYNGSGKSASMIALGVLLFNAYAKDQVSYIQDDKDYFRIVAYFTDGITIYRDKYTNGKSMYEMYRGDECIFSTRRNGQLGPVNEVPLPIADYLGVIDLGDSGYLNFRSTIEPQLLVETTGGANYASLNTILRSEDLTNAGHIINSERNQLQSDYSRDCAELNVLTAQYNEGKGLSKELVEDVERHDKLLDGYIGRLSLIDPLKVVLENLASIPSIPKIDTVDTSQLALFSQVKESITKMESLVIFPEICMVDSSQLNTVKGISNMFNELNAIKIPPKIDLIDSTMLTELGTIYSIIEQEQGIASDIKDSESQLSSLQATALDLTEQLKSFNVKVAKCPSCGTVFSVEEGA